MIADPKGQRTTAAGTHAGCLSRGARYVVEVPDRWNGVLLLASHPVPVGPDEPPWPAADPLIQYLVASGYAVAGCANTIFWPLEGAFADHPELLDVARRLLGTPAHTVVLGMSIGGLIAAGGVQRYPQRLSGVLAIGGNLAGAVANHNRELDMAFVVKTLLAPARPLQVVCITNAGRNLELATEVLHAAQGAPAGRARLALAAAVGDIPGWHDPMAPAPRPDDFEARQRGQFTLFDEVGFLVFFLARKQVEIQARGNPSWNTGVDYRALLSRSIGQDMVEALYRSARLDLDEDLDRLSAEPRIAPDPAAVDYLERHIVITGDLCGVPALTVHTDGDGLVPSGHERAFADVVGHAGDTALLRQLYVHRGGHCTLTFAEIGASLDVLIERIEHGAWPDVEPDCLNQAARRAGAAANVLASGTPVPPAFFAFEPRPFSRPYDARDMGRRAPARRGGARETATERG